MDVAQLAVAAALAWGAGLRAYAVIFLVGLVGTLGWLELPEHLRVLQHPLVLGAELLRYPGDRPGLRGEPAQ